MRLIATAERRLNLIGKHSQNELRAGNDHAVFEEQPDSKAE